MQAHDAHMRVACVFMQIVLFGVFHKLRHSSRLRDGVLAGDEEIIRETAHEAVEKGIDPIGLSQAGHADDRERPGYDWPTLQATSRLADGSATTPSENVGTSVPA